MKISLQFHATREEVVAMVAAWAADLDLYVAVERLFPTYQLKPMGRGAAVDLSPVRDDVDRISLCCYPFDPDVTTSLEFLRRNPHVLVVSIGQRQGDSLRESVIGAMTDDTLSVEKWKKLRLRAKKSMNQGALARNPVTGTSGEAKGRYFTDGARKLADQGVKMFPEAGWVEYEFR